MKKGSFWLPDKENQLRRRGASIRLYEFYSFGHQELLEIHVTANIRYRWRTWIIQRNYFKWQVSSIDLHLTHKVEYIDESYISLIFLSSTNNRRILKHLKKRWASLYYVVCRWIFEAQSTDATYIDQNVFIPVARWEQPSSPGSPLCHRQSLRQSNGVLADLDQSR